MSGFAEENCVEFDFFLHYYYSKYYKCIAEKTCN